VVRQVLAEADGAGAEARIPHRVVRGHGHATCREERYGAQTVIDPDGKTSLACALLRAWEARYPRRRAVLVPAWKLGVARAQHGLGQGEAPEVEHAFTAGLCVIDDLGSERNTAMNAVPDVIFARALEGRPTWVTTWMTPEAVTQRYGDGIARRLFEAGRAVVVACGCATHSA
jgi:DNA replication protein DnaC